MLAHPSRSVSGSIQVDMSLNPTTQVGSAARQRVPVELVEQVDGGLAAPRRHDGPDARVGSIAVSSAARAPLGALTSTVRRRHSPTTTSYPRPRSHATATSSRGRNRSATPLDGAVTPIRSPGSQRGG